MKITRINEFRAVDGAGAELRDRLKTIIPTITASNGCLSCELLQSQKDERHVIVLEVWESIEAHQASLKQVSPDVFHEVKKLLAVPPTGEYYNS
ncbi:MAG: hypothetical protein JWQ23_1283 [Herminiimonas sp.]|nr:hypothetical protein [Herminiimonas sp.]